jgi:hypothetical protein
MAEINFKCGDSKQALMYYEKVLKVYDRELDVGNPLLIKVKLKLKKYCQCI